VERAGVGEVRGVDLGERVFDGTGGGIVAVGEVGAVEGVPGEELAGRSTLPLPGVEDMQPASSKAASGTAATWTRSTPHHRTGAPPPAISLAH
jgi:hypothetical protein